jgi:hypothetical protein
MDEFSLFILEDTLQFATEVLPAEPISECVADIRDYVDTVLSDPADYVSARQLQRALNELSAIARQNNKLVIHIRLQAIANQVKVSKAA